MFINRRLIKSHGTYNEHNKAITKNEVNLYGVIRSAYSPI